MRIVVQLPSMGAASTDPETHARLKSATGMASTKKAGPGYKIPKGCAAVYDACCGDGFVRYKAGGATCGISYNCPDGA